MGDGIIGTGSYSLRDAEYAKFVSIGADSTAIRMEGELSVGSVDIQIGAVELKSQLSDDRATIAGSRLWVDSIGSINVDNFTDLGSSRVVEGVDAVDAATTVNPVYVGGRAISGVPTEVTSADAVDIWNDTFGRQVIKGTNLGQEALDVNEIAPAMLQTINTVNLSAVGSVAGSNVGAWVNVSDFNNKTVYYEFTSGPTGGIVVQLEASSDAGSTAFGIGSQEFTDTDSNIYDTNIEHHEFIRTKTSTNSGGTLTVTITGRGGD